MLCKINTCNANKQLLYSSIIFGLVLNGNFIVNTISYFVNIPNLYAYFMLIICVICLWVNKSISIFTNKMAFKVVLVLLLQFIISYISIKTEKTDHYLLCLSGIGIPCFMIGLYEIDDIIVFKTVISSSLLCVVNYYYIFYGTYDAYNSGHQMGLAYSLLPSIVVALIVYIDFKEQKWKTYSIFVLVFSLLSLFKLTTRGAYGCLAVFVLGYAFINLKKWINSKKGALVVFSIISAILFIMILFPFYESEWYYRVFGKKSNNILNGREADISTIRQWRSVSCFIFGSGIGSYKFYTGKDYIHNLFGQVFYEQGIYSVVFVMITIVKVIINILKKNPQKTYRILLVLLSVSILKLQLSSYFWIEGTFWLFLGTALSQINKENVKIDRKENI